MKRPAALLFCMAALGAQAQAVYRCGNTYSSTPCPQGKVVEATDFRTAAQRAEARRLAADDQRLAADMRHERLVNQAMQKPALASSLSAIPAADTRLPHAVARYPLKKKRVTTKPAASTPFTAVGELSRK